MGQLVMVPSLSYIFTLELFYTSRLNIYQCTSYFTKTILVDVGGGPAPAAVASAPVALVSPHDYSLDGSDSALVFRLFTKTASCPCRHFHCGSAASVK